MWSQSEDQQAGDPRRINVLVLVQRQEKTDDPAQGRQTGGNYLLFEGESAFCPLQTLNRLNKAHHIKGGQSVLLNLLS